MHPPLLIARVAPPLLIAALIVAGAWGCKGTGTDTEPWDTSPPDLTPLSGTALACANEPMKTTGTIYYACDCPPGADPKCAATNDDPSKVGAGYASDSPMRPEAGGRRIRLTRPMSARSPPGGQRARHSTATR